MLSYLFILPINATFNTIPGYTVEADFEAPPDKNFLKVRLEGSFLNPARHFSGFLRGLLAFIYTVGSPNSSAEARQEMTQEYVRTSELTSKLPTSCFV